MDEGRNQTGFLIKYFDQHNEKFSLDSHLSQALNNVDICSVKKHKNKSIIEKLIN